MNKRAGCGHRVNEFDLMYVRRHVGRTNRTMMVTLCVECIERHLLDPDDPLDAAATYKDYSWAGLQRAFETWLRFNRPEEA